MAKTTKKAVKDQEAANFIESFAEFARTKNIDSSEVARLLEEVFRAMIRKKYGTDKGFEVIVDTDEGNLDMRRLRRVVDDNDEDAFEPDTIILSEARQIAPDFEIDEDVSEDIKLQDFGRRTILTARQTLIQKVKDLEKELLYRKYKELEHEIISAEVYQTTGRDGRDLVLRDSEGNELSLPRQQLIPKDRYRKGDLVRAVVDKVEMINGAPKIVLSRTSPTFLERLFEQEIPEIFEGLIVIKKVVREPGERAKVAVEAYDDRIDPVGACVGSKGSRIHGIVRELNNENIDVINYTENLELYISRALSPAKITNLVQEQGGRISVYMKPDQVSLAIGRGGHNIKLAGKLIGNEIDVFRDTGDIDLEEDIDMIEFADELDSWVIEELHKMGLDTAKSVLEVGREELIRRTDWEDETVDDLLALLHKEFDEEAETEEAEEAEESEEANEA
ncbi:MAG: transcription termination/antitermination protein NusA [Bacteroidetes bacterium]|nr:MAG: transcription termination/antitermination protein NusA [Bacteroidota bacterium]